MLLKKILYILFFLPIITSIAFFSFPAHAAEETNEFIAPPTLQITLSDKLKFKNIEKCSDSSDKYCIWWTGQYQQTVYDLAVGAVGIFAAVGLMVAGFIWLTAGGNASKVGEARGWLASSLTGLVLVLGSYVILYYVNPELVKIKPLKIRKVEKTAMSDSSTDSRYSNCEWQELGYTGECWGGKTGGTGQCDSIKRDACSKSEASAIGDTCFCCCERSAVSGCHWTNQAYNSCDSKTEIESDTDKCSSDESASSNRKCCCWKSSQSSERLIGGTKIGDYPNLSFVNSNAAADLAKMDPDALALLKIVDSWAQAQGKNVFIGSLITGHSYLSSSGNVSQHTKGEAFDIKGNTSDLIQLSTYLYENHQGQIYDLFYSYNTSHVLDNGVKSNILNNSSQLKSDHYSHIHISCKP
jgi:hypothetical protein